MQQIGCVLKGLSKEDKNSLPSSYYTELLIIYGKEIYFRKPVDMDNKLSDTLKNLRKDIIDALPYLSLLQNHTIRKDFKHGKGYNFSTNIQFMKDPEYAIAWGVFDVEIDAVKNPNEFAETSLVNRLQTARENSILHIPAELINISNLAHANYAGREPFMSGPSLSLAVQNLLTVYDYASSLQKLKIPTELLYQNLITKY